MAEQLAPRAYHSTAVLLPDGRVLSAGQTDGSLQTTIEIYSPPYLFAGPRPTISAAPTSLSYGDASFAVQSPQSASIATVTLIRPGTVTHGVNFDQRSVDLPFTAQSDVLTVRTPRPTEAPPGWYMLVVVDGSGIPSVASWVHIS
jgi:hypothetical protein